MPARLFTGLLPAGFFVPVRDTFVATRFDDAPLALLPDFDGFEPLVILFAFAEAAGLPGFLRAGFDAAAGFFETIFRTGEGFFFVDFFFAIGLEWFGFR